MTERRAITEIDLVDLQDHIAKAIVTALKTMVSDPDFAKSFWKRGYEELAIHSSNGASQWMGKKIAVWAATALTGYLIIWLVKTGAIK